MRVSFAWLKDFVDVKESPQALSEMLTMLGLEAEVSSTFDELNGVIIGKVESVRKHPNADTLFLVTISDGSTSVEVVCGAPNVAVGQTVPFAPIGSSLPGGFKIKKVTIRGVESTGMICSEKELGITDSHDGIMELPSSLKPGTLVSKWLKKEFNSIDLDLTPNRSDALSHLGVARDIAVKTGRKLSVTIPQKHKAVSQTNNHFPITLSDSKGCPRYVAGIVHEITVGPSPDWMVTRLKSAGLRSINNVVDISNYVLLEFGHPTHMFDLEKIPGETIDVRKGKKGEKLIGLDGESYACSPTQLLITDGKFPLAIAGVMGGESSMVTETTTSVLIESAYFDPVTVRKSAKSLGLRTEASRRFERGADINACPKAYNRVVELLTDIAGGEAVKGFIDSYPKKYQQRSVTLTRLELDAITGQKISDTFITKTLIGLGIDVQKKASSWTCVIPTFRPDIEREIDLIEEIIRMHGYDNVPTSLHFSGVHSASDPDPEASVHDVAFGMAGLGFRQCYSNSLQSEQIAKAHNANPVAMKNPLSESMAFLRTSLIPGLIEKVDFNTANGNPDLRLFEIGNTFLQKGKGLKGIKESHTIAGVVHGNWTQRDVHTPKNTQSSVFSVKGLLTSLAARFGLKDLSFSSNASEIFDHAQSIFLGGKAIGYCGVVRGNFQKKIKADRRDIYGFEIELDPVLNALSETTQYNQINAFPVSDRDLNFVLSSEV